MLYYNSSDLFFTANFIPREHKKEVLPTTGHFSLRTWEVELGTFGGLTWKWWKLEAWSAKERKKKLDWWEYKRVSVKSLFVILLN